MAELGYSVTTLSFGICPSYVKKNFLPQALLEVCRDILWSSQGRWQETLRRSIEELVQHVPQL